MTNEEIENKFKKYSPLLYSLTSSICNKYRFISYNDLFSFLSLKFVILCKKFDPKRNVFFGFWMKLHLHGWAYNYLRDNKLIYDREIPMGLDIPDIKSGRYSGEENIVNAIIMKDILKELTKEEREFIEDIYYRDISRSNSYFSNKFNISKIGVYKRHDRIMKKINKFMEKYNEE